MDEMDPRNLGKHSDSIVRDEARAIIEKDDNHEAVLENELEDTGLDHANGHRC